MNYSFIPKGYDLTRQAYIDANRMGQIHPKQAEHLASPLSWLLTFMRDLPRKVWVLIVPWVIFIFAFAWLDERIPDGYIFLLALLALMLSGGAILWVIYGYWRQRGELLQETQHGFVRHDSGELGYGKRGYQIQLSDRALQLPYTGRGDLAPGIRYRFYYLPETNTLLSAEQMTYMEDEEQAKEGLTEILIQANNFKAQALDLNRQGHLAPEQASRLLPDLLIAVFIIGILGYFFGYQIFRQVLRGGMGELGIALAVMGVVIGGFLIYGFYMLFGVLSDLFGRGVAATEGPGRKFKRTSRDSDGSSSTYYYYIIGEQRFRVRNHAFEALIDDLQYRAYFTPRRKKLVNIEALESPLDAE